jgi:hypothetical protein
MFVLGVRVDCRSGALHRGDQGESLTNPSQFFARPGVFPGQCRLCGGAGRATRLTRSTQPIRGRNLSSFKILIAGSTLAFATIGAFAQATTAPTMPRVDPREAEQQSRIDPGVAWGQFDHPRNQPARQAAGECRRRRVQGQGRGVVTAKERHHLQRRQDRARKNICHQKNDAQISPNASVRIASATRDRFADSCSALRYSASRLSASALA